VEEAMATQRRTHIKFVFQDGTEAAVTMKHDWFHELAMLDGDEVTHYMNLGEYDCDEWETGQVSDRLVRLLYRNCIAYHFLCAKQGNVLPCNVFVTHTG
jgi:hypothetical protein